MSKVTVRVGDKVLDRDNLIWHLADQDMRFAEQWHEACDPEERAVLVYLGQKIEDLLKEMKVTDIELTRAVHEITEGVNQ